MTDVDPHPPPVTPDHPNPEADPESDADDLVTLTTATTSFAAHTIAAVLQSEGLAAFVFDAGTTGLGIPLGAKAIPVQVRRADLERARRMLEQNVSDSIDIDWDEIDVGRREDDLPLHHPNRTPLPAHIAFVVAVIVVLAAIAAGVAVFLELG